MRAHGHAGVVPRKGDDPVDLFGTDRPYWQRHYGVSPEAHATPRARRAIIFGLYALLVLFVVVLLLSLITR